MRRVILTLMLIFALMAWVTAPALAQGAPFDPLPPSESDVCDFVEDQGAAIDDDCTINP